MIKSIFSRMFRRKFLHVYFGALKANELFYHGGVKFRKLDDTIACTTHWPIVPSVFTPYCLVLSINY